MSIDPTVTVGNIISAAVVGFTVLIAGWKLSIQIKELEWKMDMIWKWYAREHNISEHDKK